MSEEEFRINDRESDLKRLAEINKKEKAINFALKVSLIEQKNDLDVDTIFIVQNHGYSVCTLTDMIPCKNPHCSTCLMPDRYWKLADKIYEYIGEKFMRKAIIDIKKKKSKEVNESVDRIIDDLMKEVIGDDE